MGTEMRKQRYKNWKVWKKKRGMASKCSDDKKIAVLMVVIFLSTIVPMLVVAQYSHASADDFGWDAGMRRRVWNETHSLWAFLVTSFQNTVARYNDWQGTFTTTFVQSFQPEIFNVNAYFIVPYVMLLFFCGGTGIFLYYMFVKIMKFRKSVFVIITMLYFLIAIQYVPSTGEAFYWYNGAVAYTMAYSVMLFCIYFVLRYLFEGKKVHLVMAAFSAFFVGGGNYLTIVLLPLLLLLILFLRVCMEDNKAVRRTKFVLLPLGVFMVTAVVNIKAPGTLVRGGSAFFVLI